MQNDILFDNIYIGHSIADADAFAKETFVVKKAAEEAAEEAEKPKIDDNEKPKSPLDLKFMDDPVFYIKEKVGLFVELAKRDPIEAVKFVPEVAAGLAVGAITLVLLIVGMGAGGAAAAPSKEQIQANAEKAKAKAQETKEQVAEAVASGADRAKEEVNKRQTRSSS